MGKSEPLSVVGACEPPLIAYVQAILSPDENARLERIAELHGFKKGAFARLAILERLERYEQMASGSP